MLKGIPKPLPFLIVVVATFLLFIFFSAWAVSADIADIDERDRGLSFAITSGGSSFGTTTSGSPEQRGAKAQEEGGSEADSWWGKAVLKACPLH